MSGSQKPSSPSSNKKRSNTHSLPRIVGQEERGRNLPTIGKGTGYVYENSRAGNMI